MIKREAKKKRLRFFDLKQFIQTNIPLEAFTCYLTEYLTEYLNNTASEKGCEQKTEAFEQHSLLDTDESGFTLLHWAIVHHREDIAGYLLNNTFPAHIRAALLDSSAKDGSTALMMALEYSTLATLEFLLSQGANINKQDNWGYTALIKATEKGLWHTVKCLLRFKPRLDLKTTKGQTALSIAAARQSYQESSSILKLLCNYYDSLVDLPPIVRPVMPSLASGSPLNISSASSMAITPDPICTMRTRHILDHTLNGSLNDPAHASPPARNAVSRGSQIPNIPGAVTPGAISSALEDDHYEEIVDNLNGLAVCRIS